jgi:antitoxin CptB
MTEQELTSFERLLEESDHDLYAWIVGGAAPPAELDDGVLAALKESAWRGLAARHG